MSAPKDNKYAMKFPTPESREALCASYCDHIASGLSKECFPDCDPQTLRKYVAEFPEDFDTAAMEKAERLNLLFWEKTGRDGTLGQIQGFNANSWKFNLQNRFNWKDKREDDMKFQKDGAAELAAALLGEQE